MFENEKRMRRFKDDEIDELKSSQFDYYMSTEDFIDQMFIALRTIYNATISIDNQSKIQIIFADNRRFNIQITEY